MSAALPDIEHLLTPLDGPDASGPDLVYDPAFMDLERAGAGKPERQYGDKLYPAEPPDWPSLLAQALPLAERSRDLRTALWLLRCATRMEGLAGAAQGLGLVSGLLDRFWPSLHPQLDAEDDHDPTMRLNALAPLTAADAVLGDLRLAGVAPERGSLTLRDLELALTRAVPATGESVPTEEGVLKAMDALCKRHAHLPALLRQAHQAASDIARQVETQVGASRAPNLSPLIDLVALPLKALDKLQPAAQVPAGAAAVPAPGAVAKDAVGATPAVGAAAAASVAAPVGIQSRADAVRELQRVCDWIEQNEPGHPAPLLIRRAQRLIGLRFIDIIRNLAPEALNQIEQLAGPDLPADPEPTT